MADETVSHNSSNCDGAIHSLIRLGEGVKFEDLVYTDGPYYKKFNSTPFTGKVLSSAQDTPVEAGGMESIFVITETSGWTAEVSIKVERKTFQSSQFV